ncbi:hypothetical protein DNU06_04610 [Putridiphycobacter roseus]|uniref:Suppressor of fused-like domain-containing protein n=1 Tax=Putridiphycobacter roseus TaxID=2219161 RepID=A0A2W1N260_9FLAO|nr:suppressor of fused domain protein [Putridiphycobacter roseus]PZE17904.1 hypothetical protein DNU06_04610 [Putridiphycobacter roseus]
MQTNQTVIFNLPDAAVCIQPENELGISIWNATEPVSGKQVLFTKGMCAFNQTDNAEGIEHVYPHVELYCLLPSYWKLALEEQQWPIAILNRLMLAPQEKGVWFGPGDTFVANKQLKVNVVDTKPLGDQALNQENEAIAINPIFKQNYMILNEPVAASEFIESWASEGVHFLSLTPIFQKEFEYKQSRSAYELFDNFTKKNVTELIDEYRKLAVKKRFFGLF